MTVKEGIRDVFLVKSRSMEFIGIVTRLKSGDMTAHGRIQYRDGNSLQIRSVRDDDHALKRHLANFCKALSGLYGTTVFHRKYKPPLRFDDFKAMFVQQPPREGGEKPR
jgi:hypothetical protein